MKKSPTRTPEELSTAMNAIRANAARFLAHVTSTRARWEKFRDEIEAQDRLVRMVREGETRDAKWRNQSRQK